MRFVLVVLITAALAFLGGVVVDHYALPHAPGKASGWHGAQDGSLGPDSSGMASSGLAEHNQPATSQPGGTTLGATASSSTESIVIALKRAMARPSDRRGYTEANKLIDGIDPRKIRPIVEALQNQPNERER